MADEREELDDHDEPEQKVTVHGHTVMTNDRQGARYLRQLDTEEAKTIFRQAKTHGKAEFETRSSGGTRTNYSASHKDGNYSLKNEGKQQ